MPLAGYFFLVTCIFAYTMIANVFERPDGVIISAIFIFLVLLLSGLSRYARSRELRVADVVLWNAESQQLWAEIAGRNVNLVPFQSSGAASRSAKAAEIRAEYKTSGPMDFLNVHLLDNRSEFLARLRLLVRREEQNYVIDVWGAVAVANTIAYISELIDPKSIFLVLSQQNLMSQGLDYLLWGEREIGLMVYTILVRYWELTKKPEPHPKLYLLTC